MSSIPKGRLLPQLGFTANFQAKCRPVLTNSPEFRGGSPRANNHGLLTRIGLQLSICSAPSGNAEGPRLNINTIEVPSPSGDDDCELVVIRMLSVLSKCRKSEDPSHKLADLNPRAEIC
ncbi:hypothetical protein PSTG_16582 [Puccinia striiformis f. sp. tritici PST-78]|uniref:Uncharacterized protein n=1 Tax=Puccinia striiformis f. sp. tritici PST-78 TaxID=1165861 RepID=A0A0L0USL9_9BASI|nr:hypothetical protein PSTG_16582 [Puccinia striiformis f. sp. tritici PST-78]